MGEGNVPSILPDVSVCSISRVEIMRCNKTQSRRLHQPPCSLNAECHEFPETKGKKIS